MPAAAEGMPSVRRGGKTVYEPKIEEKEQNRMEIAPQAKTCGAY